MKSKKNKKQPWHWPFQRINSSGAREYSCEHGVGHGGIHGCDGCCFKDPNYPGKKMSIEWDEDGEQE